MAATCVFNDTLWCNCMHHIYCNPMAQNQNVAGARHHQHDRKAVTIENSL